MDRGGLTISPIIKAVVEARMRRNRVLFIPILSLREYHFNI